MTDTDAHRPDRVAYRIVERRGGGGMGVMYKAEDTRLHRLVALKIPVKIVLEPGANRDRHLRHGMKVAPNVYLQ